MDDEKLGFPFLTTYLKSTEKEAFYLILSFWPNKSGMLLHNGTYLAENSENCLYLHDKTFKWEIWISTNSGKG